VGFGDSSSSEGGGSFIDPVTAAAIASSVAQGIGALSGGGENKQALRDARATDFFELIRKEAERRQSNEQGRKTAEINAPIIRQLIQSLFSGGVDDPFSLLAAQSRPRTFQTGGAGESPGVSLSAPTFDAEGNKTDGAQATPDQLDALVPDFNSFRGLRERGRRMSENITSENLFTPQDTTLGELSNFNATRSAFQDEDPEQLARLGATESGTPNADEINRKEMQKVLKILTQRGVGI